MYMIEYSTLTIEDVLGKGQTINYYPSSYSFCNNIDVITILHDNAYLFYLL